MLFSPINGWIWSPIFFQETIQRRDEIFEEPGDAVLLSDAVCSEHHGWAVWWRGSYGWAGMSDDSDED